MPSDKGDDLELVCLEQLFAPPFPLEAAPGGRAALVRRVG